jgi:hypothetical protein
MRGIVAPHETGIGLALRRVVLGEQALGVLLVGTRAARRHGERRQRCKGRNRN